MSTQQSRFRDHDYSTEGGPPKWVPAALVFTLFFAVATATLAMLMVW